MKLNLKKIYSLVHNDTLLDENRLFILLKLLSKTFNMPGVIAEFGVFKGGTAKAIAEICIDNNIEKDIYLFDTFSGPTTISRNNASPYFNKIHSFELIETYDYVKYLLSEYSNVKIIKGDIMDTAKQLEEIICFSHIDLNYKEPTEYILPIVWQKTKIGGIILIDDYGFNDYVESVKKVVDNFLHSKLADKHILNTGQCVIYK